MLTPPQSYYHKETFPLHLCSYYYMLTLQVVARNEHGSEEKRVELEIVSDTEAPEFNATVYSIQLFHGQSGIVPIGRSTFKLEKFVTA